MYEEFFGLHEKPFSIQPDPSFLYWARGHRLAYAMLEYGVLNHAGISVITGEVGCGKTTLIHRLLNQLSDTHTVALLSNIQEGRGNLLSWVLMGFGQPFTEESHVGLFSQLQSFFISEYAQGKRIVLIIDEAQNLSIDMLEEIRLLSNINAGKDQLLQLILVGQPELKDLLNRPEMLQLAQRVGADFHLTPLGQKEVKAYIETRLTIAGCRRRIFTDRAIDLVAEQSRGVPRVINIVADTALVYAYSAGDLVVGVETIRNVVRDKLDYGVFGLASDDASEFPSLPSARTGPDAFVDRDAPAQDEAHQDYLEKSANDDEGRAVDVEPSSAANQPMGEPYREAEPRPDAVATAFPTGAGAAAELALDVEPEPEPEFETKTETELEPEALPDPEPENDQTGFFEPKPQPSAYAASISMQASSLNNKPQTFRGGGVGQKLQTGFVVIGNDPAIDPEAAIRSCGENSAVVFVSDVPSQEAAEVASRVGASVVEPGDQEFSTSGRARNAGYRQLKKIAPHIQYVQFLNAAHVLDPDWISAGEGFLARRQEVSLIEGGAHDARATLPPFPTLKEMKQKDLEGEIQSVADSALLRTDAFEAIGGFRGDLATGETHDLCIRMRRRGGRVWRLNTPMLITSYQGTGLGDWWRIRKDLGFEQAYCAALHGAAPDRLGVRDTARATFWGFLFPLATLLVAVAGFIACQFGPLDVDPWIAAGGVLTGGLVVYLLKIIAGAFARGFYRPSAWGGAFLAVLGSFANFQGVSRFWFGREKPSRNA